VFVLRPYVVVLFLFSLLPCFSRPVLAQAPPTPPPSTPISPSEPAPVWSGKIELSFVSASGNSSARTFGSSGELTFHPDGWQVANKGSFVRSTTDGEVSAQSTSAGSRVSHRISPRLDGYGQIDYLSNRFAGIESRVATDGGLAWNVVSQANGHSLQLTGGLGYTHENNLTDGNESFATGNAGVRYTWQLSKTAAISEDGLFTQSLASGTDWRVNNTLAVSAALNSVLSLKLSHRLDFVYQPVPGFGKTDQLTSAAIVASF
jgi:putative salt-induced outer membrane protein YdiY